ncbi:MULTISPECIES: XRE family transcriptional regulator [unclassified Breznakia]|uniref:helix-turn-helix domain-containing protein n=1 Tax=unclassified Breznakia TaxID=2623764 RepID=UPI002476AE67|nr:MULTISPECIES: XRE family transcriptional regulator [unclassified Breznakia]MDH6366904.1 transcriptional regulator with XRE-family HTH domain [Breznakia sp. PH1-1]MDH6404082.1 transcriptional regulator with XRE-family HTH domain [Breznakia sp. PF1-11]MDH6411791.1 transcriptional regulator with XRE-family HTH domain [Breznakia sp. PFB1-11]MDH6414070.1 transcriptional regulator with XRE-family HTH domain [Breznakia sp. PFB1-14]MDH6416573.1 transcriptional regulator with XRE-family HTH domain [
MDIGLKLKELRTQNGLTLDELSARSELSKGFLSQLERNLTSPSIVTLQDILEALGTNLSEFFNEEESQSVFREEDYYVSEKDGITTTFVVPNAQKNDMEPILLTLDAKSRSQSINPHEGEEFGYVIKGNVTLVNGDKSDELKQGETFYLNGKHIHYLVNDSNNEATIIWVMSPPNF